MTEPQTLDDVIDEVVTDTPEVEAEAATQELSNEDTTEAVKEDSYTRIDPKTLTPELQAMHKSLLSDYTKKTQTIAKQRKEYEEKMVEFEKLRDQPQAQPQQQTQQETPQGVSSNMSVDEYTAFMMSQVEQKLNAHQQGLLEQQEQKYLNKAVQEFEAADERLNEQSPAYDQYMRTVVGEALDKELHEYQQEHGTAIGFDYQDRTTDLVSQYEQYTQEKAKSIATQKTQEAFKGVKRTAPHGVKGTKAPSKPTGKMSLDESIDAAFSE